MKYSITQYLLLGAVALVYVGVITGPMRKIAIRYNAVDSPDMARKIQKAPVPYLGGVAIAVGVVITSYIALVAKDFSLKSIGLASSVLVPAILISAMGLWDDLRGLQPWPRLIAQSVVGTVVALVIVNSGTTGTPFGTSTLNTAISIFWIVGICNSINFFDNLDGAAVGAVAIAALGVFFIAFDRGQELVSALSIVTAGATIGFLMWNKSPAKIYMGDAGALFLGIIISVATIRLNPGIEPIWKSLTIPVILLAVPLLDTCVAVFSRISRRVSPLTGGKDHLSHRLVRAGLSRPMAAIALWAASGVCAIVAVVIYMYPDSYGTFLIYVFVASWVSALVLFLRTPSHD